MKKLTTEQFIEKSRAVHRNKYDYSRTKYVNTRSLVNIICPIHGEFLQIAKEHLNGHGCNLCGGTASISQETFIEKAKKIHGNKYDYSKTIFKGFDKKLRIICPKHGEFYQTPNAHLVQKSGCPKCKGRNLTTEDIIERFKEAHGDEYDYSSVKYVKMHEKVDIICRKHGLFQQTPSKHILGQGCKICGKEKSSKNKTLTTEEFIEKAKEIHGNKYDYSKSKYVGTYDNVTIICPKHGEFKQRANDHLNGHGCSKCGVTVSKFEEEIATYISSLDVEIIRNTQKILESGKELDIFIPSKSIAIECDGLLWHSSQFKEKNYHLEKTQECEKNGIQLIHIFEDEWNNKKEIVKSILASKIGKYNNRLFARKCIVKEIDKEKKKKFINENHLQGDVGSKVDIGLFYNDELVSVMTFGDKRINLGGKKKEGEYELLRLCSKLNTIVIGGASKMLKYFISKYSPINITSYCDRRYSNGKSYEKIGFSLSHISRPNYYYIIGNNRKNRFSFRKDRLISFGFDSSKSESEIMEENGINKIYDCGNYVFKFIVK